MTIDEKQSGVGAIDVRVRYAETDRMGVVHHATYLIWFEAGRTDFMRRRGVSYKKLEEKGVYLPVSEAYCRNIRPAFYDDVVTIETRVEAVKSRQIVFKYRALRECDILATGRTVHICTDRTSKPMVIPKHLKNDLKQYVTEIG